VIQFISENALRNAMPVSPNEKKKAHFNVFLIINLLLMLSPRFLRKIAKIGIAEVAPNAKKSRKIRPSIPTSEFGLTLLTKNPTAVHSVTDIRLIKYKKPGMV